MKQTALKLIKQFPILTVLFFFYTDVNANVEIMNTLIHLSDLRSECNSIFLDSVTCKKIYFPNSTEAFIKGAYPAGIKYALAVEVSFPREDNFRMSNLVDTPNTIKAFIANLDPRDPYFRDDLDSLLLYKKFGGISIRTKTSIDHSRP